MKDHKIKSYIKMCILGVLMTGVMGCVVFAGTGGHTYSYSTPFTVPAGNHFWNSDKVNFSEKSDHTMRVDFNRTYAKGTARVSIARKVFATYLNIAYSDIAINTGTTGVSYNLSFEDISKGDRYYIFGSDDTANYQISSFSDSW